MCLLKKFAIDFMKSARHWVFVVSIVAACQPDGPFPYHEIPDVVKPYVIFPEGSYWIYEEVDDHRIDSVYLYRVETKQQRAAQRLGYNYEGLWTGYNRPATHDSIWGVGQPSHFDEFKWWLEESWVSDPYTNLQPVFMYPMEIGENVNFGSGTIEYSEYHETMPLNGQDYKDVMVFIIKLGREPELTARVAYAEDVGVIRKELTDGSIWELKRYFINR